MVRRPGPTELAPLPSLIVLQGSNYESAEERRREKFNDAILVIVDDRPAKIVFGGILAMASELSMRKPAENIPLSEFMIMAAMPPLWFENSISFLTI